MNSVSPKRILAVDPGMQYLGIAVFEGENLLWYGVKTFAEQDSIAEIRSAAQQYLTAVHRKYAPTLLAVEEPFYAQSLLSDNLKKLTIAIKTWGKWRRLRVRGYSPPVVKAFFCRDRKTKDSLAEALVERYPFLRRYWTNLPWRRRYWFHVFDAIGLGLMCAQKERR